MNQNQQVKPKPITMHDGSVFEWGDGILWTVYCDKVPPAKREKSLRAFKDAVKKHWEGRTVLTPTGNQAWEKEYANHAELGQEVMVAFLHARLIGIAIQQLMKHSANVVIGEVIIRRGVMRRLNTGCKNTEPEDDPCENCPLGKDGVCQPLPDEADSDDSKKR